MLAISREDVVAKPFPHVIKDGILPPDFYKALRADFPTSAQFEEVRQAHGRTGSRTGSGFDIYRGEPEFRALTGRSEAWREFEAWINSEAFADKFREVFADHLDDIGLQVDVRRSHVNTAYAEPRELLTETATLGDKVAAVANVVTRPFSGKKPVELFTRLDIHKSTSGYAKKPHCDRPNRLCSLIIYFCDADERGLKGGDLQIFAHNENRPVQNYERYPHAENVTQVAQLRPKENLGVFFPCQNNSYHGVTQVESNGVERDFLYINISGRTRWLW